MIVKRVVLDNIRSYVHEQIDFPAGSILLSGNIGSGKSTILMAIEFALFGLKRGELTGAGLLRNGADKGSVEVCLDLEGNEVTIGRALKRASSGIVQDAGFIESKGERKPLTAVEIKQKVLEYLNYPKEALTKNEMLFRYTVYVSQEEMKQILLGDKEQRLNALRYVFGIDKYKRVKENAKIVASKAGEKKKEFLGFISDLDAKKASEKSKSIELETIGKELEIILPKADELKIAADKRKADILELEQQISKANELKKELAVCEQKARLYEIQKANEDKELKRIDEKIRLSSSEQVSGRDFAKELWEKRSLIKEIEAKISAASGKIYELNAGKRACEELKRKIRMLDKCPTCMQEVKTEHKQSITSEEDRKLAEIEKEFLLHSNEEDSLRQAVNKINLEIEKIWDEEKKEVMLKARLRELEDSVKQKDAVIERRKKAEDELKNALEKKEQITAGLAFFADAEKKHIEARKLYDSAALLHREAELKKAQLETRKEMSLRALNEISAEIKKKEDAKKILEKISLLKQWLEYYFMPMMDDMEKSVMAKAHTDFSSLLSKWFSMLVDNEAINVRLDPEFTPMIEQNGYEIDYGFLSGGEKTAAALAYRLALNQVVNNLMSEIRTKDIIILDEPTDGFSEEQLEKMKFVLDELSIGQIIIVSHEQKIESFVDNVIRFEKAGHVSKISM